MVVVGVAVRIVRRRGNEGIVRGNLEWRRIGVHVRSGL